MDTSKIPDIHRPRTTSPFDELSKHRAKDSRYVGSTHAAEELDDDSLSILDFENTILTGQIVERQRDTKTREVKCVEVLRKSGAVSRPVPVAAFEEAGA